MFNRPLTAKIHAEDHYHLASSKTLKNYKTAQRKFYGHRAGMAIGAAIAIIAILGGTASILALTGHLPHALNALHILSHATMGGAIGSIVGGAIISVVLVVANRRRDRSLQTLYNHRILQIQNETSKKLAENFKNKILRDNKELITFLNEQNHDKLIENQFLTLNKSEQRYYYNLNHSIYNHEICVIAKDSSGPVLNFYKFYVSYDEQEKKYIFLLNNREHHLHKNKKLENALSNPPLEDTFEKL